MDINILECLKRATAGPMDANDKKHVLKDNVACNSLYFFFFLYSSVFFFFFKQLISHPIKLKILL